MTEKQLIALTKAFGKHHAKAAQEEAKKKELRDKFFAAATELNRAKRRAQKVIDIPATEDLDAWVKAYHPGWIIDLEAEISGDKMVLEEDPALMKFVFPNPEDGQVYGRTYEQGPEQLDDERLRAELPELWQQVSEWPVPDWIGDLLYENGIDADEIDERLEIFFGGYAEQLGIERVLVSPDKLTDEDLAALQPYMVPGAMKVKMQPVRQAKPEELE